MVLIGAGLASLATSQATLRPTTTSASGETELKGDSPLSLPFVVRSSAPSSPASAGNPEYGIPRVTASIDGTDAGGVQVMVRLRESALDGASAPVAGADVTLPQCLDAPCDWDMALDISFARTPVADTRVKWTVRASIYVAGAATLAIEGLPSSPGSVASPIVTALQVALPLGLLGGLILAVLGVALRTLLVASAGALGLAGAALLWSSWDAGAETALSGAVMAIACAVALSLLSRRGRSAGTAAVVMGCLFTAFGPVLTYTFVDAALVRPLDAVLVALILAVILAAAVGSLVWALRSRAASEGGDRRRLAAAVLGTIVAAAMSAWCFELAGGDPNLLRGPAVAVAAPASAFVLFGARDAAGGRGWPLLIVGISVFALAALSVLGIILNPEPGGVLWFGPAPSGSKPLLLLAAGGIAVGAMVAGLLAALSTERELVAAPGWPPAEKPQGWR
jgi:hypothetical protein